MKPWTKTDLRSGRFVRQQELVQILCPCGKSFEASTGRLEDGRGKLIERGSMSRLRLSCDDGCRSDVRVAALAKKYNIDCVFYFPVEWAFLARDKGYEPLTMTEALEIAKDFEVGSHTITHRHLTQIPPSDAMYEIAESYSILKRLFNQPIEKFCPPRGYTNEALTDYTMRFYKSQRLTKGAGLVHVHPKSGANGNIHWLEYVKTHEITEAWMHSWELDRYPEEWINLEKWLREYASK